MPLAIVLVSLLGGEAFTAEAAGRLFVISWVDLAALVVGGVGLIEVVRTRRLVLDPAMWAYLALIAVVGVQIATIDAPLDTAGGLSRFVTAALVLFGLCQLAPAEADPAHLEHAPVGRRSLDNVQPWRWPLAIAVFGSVLACWIAVDLVQALTDPALATFYDVKNAIAIPLGASNYLAGFLVVAVLVSLVAASEDRRFATFGIVTGLGLLATMSRGGVLAVAVSAAAVVMMRRTRALVVAALVVLGVAGSAFLLVVAGVTPVDVDGGGARAAELDTSAGRRSTAFYSPTDDRIELYERAWETFLDEPLIGIGLNQFATVTTDLESPHVNAHNLELHALAETGVLGTTAYLALWAILAWRIFAAAPGVERAALGAASGGLFLHAQIEALSFTRGIEVMLAILLVLAGTLDGARPVKAVNLARRR